MNNLTNAEPPKPQTVTAERINQAISWYEANAEAIDAALPIHTPGVLYNPGCLKLLDRFVLAWKAGEMPLNLAECYIHRPLTIFYQELKKRKESGNHPCTSAK
ncbi:MAG: hypothetical protein HC800_14855 [Phormidesmis sp. RL_2_1]|nr:hypothetical protein [Phormidesmis sp. RL_2_1]